MTGDLPTVAESSGFRRTALHREVVEFLSRLESRSAAVRVSSMGRSGLGQDMPVAVLSGDGAFAPEAAHASGRPVVLVVANIHAGEVEAKEASLALAREAALGSLRPLLDRATVLLVPDYNPDGNDRIDPANRALDLARLEGQVGPKGGVGTRTTGEGWNLNRDYTKQDAVETRNLAALMALWRPHVVVDGHTTDGSIHGYELTFDTSRNLASCPRGPATFARDVLLPEVAAEVRRAAGFRTWYYGNHPDPDDPASGWETYPPLPRYGSHFRGLLGCVDVLLEAYSYVDFETRFRVTLAWLTSLLERVGSRGPEVTALVAAAARDTVERGRRPAPNDLVGIDYGRPVRGAGGVLSFRHEGFVLGDHDVESWDAESLRARRVPGRTRRTVRATYYGRNEPTSSVQRPFAYVVPAARRSAVERLATHRLEVARVVRAGTASVEEYGVVSREPCDSPDVGTSVRTETVFRVEARRARMALMPGDLVVPTAQAWGHLAIYLLEPHSDDGLARWGHFDDVKAGDAFPVRRIPQPEDLPAGSLD